MVAQMMMEERESSPLEVVDHIDKTKTLICALNLLSRNLPLPPHLFDAVSCIYGAAPAVDPVPGVTDDGVGGSFSAAVENVTDDSEISSGGDLMRDLEDAMAKQRTNCISGSGLTASSEA